MSSETEKSEAAGVVAPAASEPQNPTVEVKAQESEQIVEPETGKRKRARSRETNVPPPEDELAKESGIKAGEEPSVETQEDVSVDEQVSAGGDEITLGLADDGDSIVEGGYFKARPLSQKEMDLLDEYEEVIRDGLPVFLAVGRALADIKRRKLYRTLFKTFQEYCDKRLGMSRAFAHMQAAAAEAMENILKSGENLPAPTTERQLRGLAGHSANIQVEAWKLAQTFAGGRKVTGQHVEMAIKQLVGKGQQEADWLSSTVKKLMGAGYTQDFEPPVNIGENEWVDLYDAGHGQFIKLMDKATLASLAICLAMRERGIKFQVVVNGNGIRHSQRELSKSGAFSTIMDPLLSVLIKNLDAFVEFKGDLYESGNLGPDSTLSLKRVAREEAEDLALSLKIG